MAGRSLTSLTTPLTSDEVSAAIYAAVAARGVATTNWKPGAAVRTIIAAVSIVLSAFSSLVAQIARMGFLELSSGDWLTLVAKYVYGVDRLEATFAAGNVTLTNTGGGVYSGGVGELIVFNSATGARYRSTSAYSLGALGSTTVPVSAIEAGQAGTSVTGGIDSFETPLLGVTVTNATALVGSDDESDTDLRQRCLDATAIASPNGPADAYSYFARSARRSDGTPIGVTRVRTVPATDGTLTVYVATASGEVTGTSGDPATDLGAIADAIWSGAEPQCVTATVASASTQMVHVSYRIYCYDNIGLTDLELTARVEAALAAWIAVQPIGGNRVDGAATGYLYSSHIVQQIYSISSKIYHVELVYPSGEYTLLSQHRVPVLGAVTPVEINREPAVQ